VAILGWVDPDRGESPKKLKDISTHPAAAPRAAQQ
jgi:hypothetical protein